MGLLDLFAGAGAKGVGELVKDVVSTFKLSPQAKAEFEAKLEEHKFQLAQLDAQLEEAKLKHDTDIQTQAAETIRAEATSEDPFVRRARPAFLWMMTVGVGISLIIFPLINACTGKGLVFPEIPTPYLELFGAGFLGYTGARSFEKAKGVQ
jgi:hypothetical protein